MRSLARDMVTYERHGQSLRIAVLPLRSIAFVVHKTRTITDLCNAYGNHMEHRRVPGLLVTCRVYGSGKIRFYSSSSHARVSDTKKTQSVAQKCHVRDTENNTEITQG